MTCRTDAGVVCAVLTLLAMCGCVKPVSPDWQSAKIDIYWDFATGRPLKPERMLQINDHEEVNRLASFFPGMGQGRVSREARTCSPGMKIEFRGKDKNATVITEYHFKSWSEGKGDWPLQPEFQEYFMTLLKEHAASVRDRP